MAEARALDERIATLARRAGDEPVPAQNAETSVQGENTPWRGTSPPPASRPGAEGKLILIDFYTDSCGWCKRLDSEVFPNSEVAKAMRAFVPVRVDPKGGEGRPLAAECPMHISGYPAILCVDPAIDDPQDARIVGRSPASCRRPFAEQLHAIATAAGRRLAHG